MAKTALGLSVSLEEAFPETSSEFMLWMSREEWQYVYCLSLSYMFSGELNADLEPKDFFRAVMAVCQHDYGHEWVGVDLDEECRAWPKQAEPVEMGIIAWLHMLGPGAPNPETGVWETPPRPNLAQHFPVAMDYAERYERLQPTRERLYEAWDKVQKDLEMVKAIEPTPEEREAMREAILGPVN